MRKFAAKILFSHKMESLKQFEKNLKSCRDFKESDFSALLRASENGHIGVACSGGCDSMFLLCACVALLGSDKISVLHFNHGVRKAADIDEKLVREFCKKNKLKFFSEKNLKLPRKITEEILREMRLKFFHQKFNELKLSAIAQGHHLGDVCESLIMRLARGSNLEGMCSPRAESFVGKVRFLRPLLNFEKETMKCILKKSGISWREDESNADPKFFRNAVRNDIIPSLEKFSPLNFKSCVKRTRRLFEEDCDFIDARFDEIFNPQNADFICGKNISQVKIAPEILQSSALLRRLIMKLIVRNSLEKSFRAPAADAAIEKIKTFPEKAARFSLKKYFLIYEPAKRTQIEKTAKTKKSSPQNLAKLSLKLDDRTADKIGTYSIALKFGKTPLPLGGAIIVKKIELSKEKLGQIIAGKVDESKNAYFAASHILGKSSKTLVARSGMPDDEYSPMGSLQKRKISKMLSSKKVPPNLRKTLPRVVLAKGEIIWVPHLPPALKLDDNAESKSVIELTFLSQ